MPLVDRPEQKIEADRLDRGPIVKTLCDALTTKSGELWKSSETVVGLTGEWGSGKSSILNYVEENLGARNGIQIVRFNPWIITGHGDLIDVYFREMSHQLGRSKSESVRELGQQLDKYRNGIATAADFVFPSAGRFIKSIPIVPQETLSDKRKKLERKLSQFNGGIVVIIDELDRVEDEDIRELARFVKAIGDLPNVSYLIGYDHVRVQAALSRGREVIDGEDYLKKIVQVNIPIRPLMDYEVDALLEEHIDIDLLAALRRHGEEWDDAKSKIFRLIETPRELKRYIATVKSYWDGAGQEVHPVDLALFSVLASSSSDLRAFLVSNLGSIIDDPRDPAMEIDRILNEKDGKNVLSQIGFDEERFGRFEGVLTTLFPRLKRDDRPTDFGRISRFENFICLVYFGDPPFRLSRREVHEFWADPSTDWLREIKTEGKLEAFPRRLEKLIDSLPEDTDERVFHAISEFNNEVAFERPGFRQKFPEELRWSIVRAAGSGLVENDRLAKVLRGLREINDYSILPDLVRHHMFAFGLAEGFEARDYPTVISESDFPMFLQGELERYRDSVLHGRWTREFLDADPLFAIHQGNALTPKIVEGISDALNEKEGVWRFCELFLPGGVSTEKRIIELFVDTETLESTLEELLLTNPVAPASATRMLELVRGNGP